MAQQTLQLRYSLSRGLAHVDAIVSSLRAAAHRVSEALDAYSEIQLNARAAPARERKHCHGGVRFEI